MLKAIEDCRTLGDLKHLVDRARDLGAPLDARVDIRTAGGVWVSPAPISIAWGADGETEDGEE